MILIFLIIAALVGWALHLMQEAIDRQEFSLMLAGFLVSCSAAALVAVYFLMMDYALYMANPYDASYSAAMYTQAASPEVSSTLPWPRS